MYKSGKNREEKKDFYYLKHQITQNHPIAAKSSGTFI